METSLKGRCPFRGHFFELTSDYIRQVVYEQIFYLIKNLSFSFSEAYSLPIGLRKWFVDRDIQEETKSSEN